MPTEAITRAIVRDPLLRRISTSAWIIFSGNSAVSVLNVVSFAIMASQTGASSLAIFALTQNYVLILNDVFNVQTWEALVTFCASDKKEPRTASILKTNCYIDISSAVVGTLVALLMLGSTARYFGWGDAPLRIVGLYCLTILFNLTSLTIGIPRLFNRFGTVARIQVVTAVVKLCGIGAVSLLPNPAIGRYIVVYLLADIGTNLATIVLAVRLVNRHYGSGWWRQPATLDRDLLRFVWWTNLRTVSRIPVRHFDMVIIASVMSLELVGAYRVYKEIAGIITRVGDPVNQAIFPEFARLINSGSTRSALRVGKKTVTLMAVASAGIVLPLLLTSRFVVTQFFGPSYLGWMPALQMMIVVYGMGFALIPVNSLFIAAGFARSSFWVVTLTNSVYLLTAYLLGRYFGIYGIVAAHATQSLLNSGIKVLLLARPQPATS